MILPSKHVSQEGSLLGIGALLLDELDQPQTVTSLWERAREDGAVGTFERFVLGVDMLYIIGAVRLKNGLIERTRR